MRAQKQFEQESIPVGCVQPVWKPYVLPVMRHGEYPYHVTCPMMHLMLPSPREQTDACENITFPQLPHRAVITF